MNQVVYSKSVKVHISTIYQSVEIHTSFSTVSACMKCVCVCVSESLAPQLVLDAIQVAIFNHLNTKQVLQLDGDCTTYQVGILKQVLSYRTYQVGILKQVLSNRTYQVGLLLFLSKICFDLTHFFFIDLKENKTSGSVLV